MQSRIAERQSWLADSSALTKVPNIGKLSPVHRIYMIMNHSTTRFVIAILVIGLFAVRSSAQELAAVQDITKITSVPEGKYAVDLIFDGKEVKTEFAIYDGKARCLASENAPGDRIIEGASGAFQAIGNGVFLISLQGSGYRASQFWLFKPDGSIDVKEFPDRGESQKAVRIGNLEEAEKQKRPTIADGKYAVTLEVDGNPVNNVFLIKNGTATCVKSDEEAPQYPLLGATATFEPLGESITQFRLSLRGRDYYRSQIWTFLSDGSAIIKEIPDRGEKEKAVIMKE
jgi:hypothetical protein